MNHRIPTFASCTLLALGAAAFTFDDIHFWAGEGTSKCAVVIDWGARGPALAWGYRWKGVGTNVAEVVRRIVHEDPRLVSDGAGTMFGYDVNDRHASFDKSAGTSGDPAAYAAANGSAGAWRLFGPFASADFPTTAQAAATASADRIVPAANQWFALRFTPQTSGPERIAAPAFAESPYGYEVVDSSTLEKSPLYNRAANVLGAPARGIFSASAQYDDTGSVIHPAYPAWGGGLLFSLIGDEDWEEPGYVTIKVDHDVVDDPKNPFGIDFLVFGNSFAVKQGTSYVTLGGDPSQVRFTGQGSAEGALVEVSQDGETWYAFEDGPYADDAMPTLGYLYDPEHADAGLFGGNAYWGLPAHATRPLDPSRGFGDFAGMTLAQACRAYNGSAGGTGFDLGELWDLPENADGRKWIRYVRISCLYSEEPNEDGDFGYTMPEVDAVADVAPASDYELWAQRYYSDWTTAWRDGTADALAENGLPNALCFAWGLAPWSSAGEDVPLRIDAFTPGEDVHILTVKSPVRMQDAGGIVVRATSSLSGGWMDVVPALVSSERMGGAYVNTFAVPASAGAFLKLAVPTE